jgi:hypothetical protein
MEFHEKFTDQELQVTMSFNIHSHHFGE